MRAKLARFLMNFAYFLRQEHKLAYLMEQWAHKLDKNIQFIDSLPVRGRYDR